MSSVHSTDRMINTSVLQDYSVFSKIKTNVVFSGIAHEIDSKNIFVFPLLSAEQGTYSSDGKEYFNYGENSKIVSLYQSRRNSRAAISGSMDICSNKAFFLSREGQIDLDKSQNAVFCREMVEWVAAKTAVLAHSELTVEGDKIGEFYKVGTQITLSLSVTRHSKGNSVPYSATDFELEVILLETVMRMPLKQRSPGIYSVTFKAPTVKGVYKMNITYRRKGFSNIFSTTKVTFREPRHDEIERFHTNAFPYYFAFFGLVFVFVLFTFSFLFLEEKAKKE